MVLTPRGRIVDIRNIDMFDNNAFKANLCVHVRVSSLKVSIMLVV